MLFVNKVAAQIKCSQYLLFFLLNFCILHRMGAQKAYSNSTLSKIHEVENNIIGRTILNDEKPHTLLERMKKYNVKGLSMAVIHDYKLEWAKGYGWADEERKIPVTTSTLFEPGSISKTLNAVGILKLVQEGKLSLDEDINTYLKSWKFPYDSLSNGKKITLAHILTHQAGLSVHGFPGHNMYGPIPTLTEVLDGRMPAVTSPVRSEFEPGLKFQYSGGGTSISQMILTDVTGEPYDAWMYKNVLKPIGMIHSTYAQPPSKDIWNTCATAYYRDGKPLLHRFHMYPEQAAAGLWMTPSDLAQYVMDMQLAYKKKGSSKVLNSDMVAQHLTPYHNGPTAMGTFIDDLNGATYFQHSAGNDGFCGFFFASLDDGNGLIVFMNIEYAPLLSEINMAVAKAYGWKNFYKEPQKRMTGQVITVPDATLSSYEGIYLYDNSWAMIHKKNKQYVFTTDGTDAKMYFTSPTCFYNEEFSAIKNIIKDPSGTVVGYTRTVDGKEYPKANKLVNLDTLSSENGSVSSIAWYMLENKRYKEAISFYQKAITFNPGDLNLQMNLAHAYLLGDEMEKGLAIHHKNLDKNISLTVSWKDQLLQDYMYMKEHYYDVKKIELAFQKLNIKKPKGY